MLWTRKRIIPAVIILFWLVMVGGLLYREVALPYLYRGIPSARTARPQNIWLGLYFGEEQRVGFVHLRTTPEDRDFETGYAMNVLARLEFPLFGDNARFQLTGEAWQSIHDGLRTFAFSLDADGHAMRIEGVAEDGVIRADLHTGGEKTSFSLPVGRQVLLSGGMGLSAASIPAMTPGEIIYMDAFDPTTMSTSRAKLQALRHETVEVSGAPVETVVIATTVGPVTTHVWISEEEEVIRAETPFGLIIKKISPEEALSPTVEDEAANMVRALAVTATGAPPDPDADVLRLRITADDPSLLPPQDNRQKREDDVYIIRRQNPLDTARHISLSEDQAQRYVASDMFIQSEHPRIRSFAESLVEDADTPWEKALSIYDWLYDAVEKEHVLSVPSALEVLEQLRGDCNEHAILFAALARAAGIPTRVVIGLAWSREMERFGYHAWNEVFVGKWVAIDATFGEKVVGPTHIKLITGGIDQWPRLLPYIGALGIEVVNDAAPDHHPEATDEVSP